jgi:hypothetical protein
MSSADRYPIIALVLLASVAAVFELSILPNATFRLAAVSSEWPFYLHILALALPRLIVMLFLLGLLGNYLRRLWLYVFAGGYAVLLVISFNRTELFVDWTIPQASIRATVPYFSGFVGAAVGWVISFRHSR